ncbi:MAG: transcriptional repressor [Nitrospirae bacterium]|jgi:Fur family peroxide stress response transcriptional regulator|nr:transcriptional repressor [Nitrospirota bacterium]
MKELKEKEYIKRFQKKGLKLTNQRLAVYQALVSTDTHPTADGIYQEVKAKYPMISLNTVYNTLEVLKEIGEISQINTDVSARFDANMLPHHHLVCLQCRKIEDFVDHDLDQIELKVAGRKDFKIVGHRVEFQGYCKKCQQELSREE